MGAVPKMDIKLFKLHHTKYSVLAVSLIHSFFCVLLGSKNKVALSNIVLEGILQQGFQVPSIFI